MVRQIKNVNGFTLAELIIVMGLFVIILLISASAFESVLKVSLGLSKSAQSQMEGIVGLEILRKDLNSAGYGLPWSFNITPDPTTYLEADYGPDNPVKGLSGDSFNDARAMYNDASPLTPVPPRAVVLGTVPASQATIYQTRNSSGSAKMNANPGSAYLVIKSSTVAFNTAVGKWGYVNYSGSGGNNSYITKFNSAEDFAANEVVITHINTFSGTNQVQHQLAMQDASNFAYTLVGQNAAGNFLPTDNNYKPSGNIVDPLGAKINNEKLVVYALKKLAVGSTETVRMPFNRADYYVKSVSDMPAYCNPGTGILYKTVINNQFVSSDKGHSWGKTDYPLIDCVGDMQVIFNLQHPTDANITMTVGTLAGLTAEDIRSRLKTIRVYLLVHEGGIDRTYQYPVTDANKVISVSDDRNASLGRTFTATDMTNFFGPEWRNYRWKVYSVVGQPYNLLY